MGYNGKEEKTHFIENVNMGIKRKALWNLNDRMTPHSDQGKFYIQGIPFCR
jgi:hypothetical protein